MKNSEKLVVRCLISERNRLRAEKAEMQQCCGIGSFACQVPMPIGGRVVGIDFCIADIVAALNAANIQTVASCCGHGEDNLAIISLADGRELNVKGSDDE